MKKLHYVLQWENQPTHMTKSICSLMEMQSLVDLTIICNSYSIKVHKCILAANSVYFRERLQKDMSIDRVVINGIKHSVLRALISFIYCGEASISEENIQELIAAANFFSIRGITSILPEKLGKHLSEEYSFNLMTKPPVFFSKNDKAKIFGKDRNSSLSDKNIKFLLEDDYNVYGNSGRNRLPQGSSKVTDEAHVALAKEEAASRFALEMLKKDINNTSNVFVIDETCTEATVETNLTAQYGNANMMQIQGYVIDNEIPDIKSVPDDLSKTSIHEIEPKQSPRDDQQSDKLNEPFDTVIYKSNDGNNYVNVSNQILEGLSNAHTIAYQVMPEHGHVDFQQYICNGFGDFTVEVENAQPQNTVENPCFEILKHDNENDQKKQLTFTQLVADTVSSEYEPASMMTQYSSAPIEENISNEIPENSGFNNILSGTKQDELFIPVQSESEPKLHDVMNEDVVNENAKEMGNGDEITQKKKRGRPPKRKLVEKNTITESKENLYEEKFEENSECKTQILSKDYKISDENNEKIQSEDAEVNNETNLLRDRKTISSFSGKFTDEPQDILLSESKENIGKKDLTEVEPSDIKGEQENGEDPKNKNVLFSVEPMDNTQVLSENRRHTRSSFKQTHVNF